MRNVILTAPTLSAVSGIATHVDQLMHSTLRQDLRVAHFCAGGEGLVESRAARLRRRAVTPIAWATRLRRDGLPLVHINTALDRKALARDALLLLIAKIMRCPVVWQVHGGCAPSEFCRGRATRKLLRGLLALADRVVVISRADAAAYRSFVVPARLCKISNAVDATEFDSIDRCIDVNRPLRIVFMGRLIVAKGVLDAVDAIAAVRAQDVHVVLQVAGTGPAAPDVARRVSLHGLQGQIQMLGNVAGQSKWDLLARSDLFVLPTYHRERMPYGLLEAMAAGVVPLVCAAGDIDELVIPEQHGFVLEPHRPDLLARAIVQLARDREHLAQLSQACKARVRELHGIQRMAGEFRRLYLNVCSS
jgi:glycosyltransferase involved in cell wall biosynthesis